jgi:ethanolamine ammonia-lyase small subunit
MSSPPTPTTPVLWRDLRRFTPARVALGRAGNALPTAAHLDFQAAHAAARDAVDAELDPDALAADLAAAGLSSLQAASACPDRRTYLLRPDLGRRLANGEAARLPRSEGIAFVIADGLSATAAQRHAAPLLARVLPALGQQGPVVIARQARVALADEIAAAMGAEAVAILIGERPGLSSPDSLGVYLTWAPRPGRTDAERNCISNIRPEGLPIPAAAAKLLWLIGAMRHLKLTGVALKDEQPTLPGADQRMSISVTET